MLGTSDAGGPVPFESPESDTCDFCCSLMGACALQAFVAACFNSRRHAMTCASQSRLLTDMSEGSGDGGLQTARW